MPVKNAAAKEASGAQTVERALLLLKLVSEEGQPVPIAKLCEQTGLNRTTAYRLLSTLESSGFLEREAVGKGYRLGYAAASLCLGIVRQYAPLIRLARPEMERLRDETQESVILAVARISGMLTIDQLDSPQAVRIKNYMDNISPFFCSSNGKIFLAQLTDDEIDAILAGPLESRTPRTVTDPDAVRAEIRKARRNGYGTVFGELDESENGISVAVHDGLAPVAFLSIAGPAFRLTRDKLLKLAPRLQQAAAEISQKLTQ
ncbi:MAG: IclR family transcriptional regulator [Planctomycetaceae bacterium]|nr:IclR family transcriptional regulator [Planctomycetaceae bacterium]